MVCPNCGAEIPEAAAFCPNCGAAAPAARPPIGPIISTGAAGCKRGAAAGRRRGAFPAQMNQISIFSKLRIDPRIAAQVISA